jgi:NDP-hexose-3-ketoreductase
MTIRIGVLGCANIAFRSVVPAILASRQFELVAAASRTREKAERMASTFGCEALRGYQALIDRDDVSALYIPLPT